VEAVAKRKRRRVVKPCILFLGDVEVIRELGTMWRKRRNVWAAV
jgi:hypothetical protein